MAWRPCSSQSLLPCHIFPLSSDTMVCTGCCATLDNIITYLFRCLTSKKKKMGPQAMHNSEAFLRNLEVHPEILQQMLSTVLNIIMFEDCRNQWSMSRPLLGLILLNEDVSCGGVHVPVCKSKCIYAYLLHAGIFMYAHNACMSFHEYI